MIIIGADISKSQIDYFIEGKNCFGQCLNTVSGIEDFLDSLPKDCVFRFVMESTSHYHRLLHRLAEERGYEVCVCNPQQTKYFSRSCRWSAKTDRLDALMLCEYGRKMDLKVTPYPKQSQRILDELLLYRQEIQEELRRVKHRSQGRSETSSLVKNHLDFLKIQLKEVTLKIRQFMEYFKEETDDMLKSIPGISDLTLAALKAWLPELGSLNRQQIGALAGLAPIANDSGLFKGKRFIHGGRKKLRDALYMPLMAAVRYNPFLKALYEKLRAAGKPPKVALIACTRKFLIFMNSLVKQYQKRK